MREKKEREREESKISYVHVLYELYLESKNIKGHSHVFKVWILISSGSDIINQTRTCGLDWPTVGHAIQGVGRLIYRTASLLRPPPPPPIFGRNYCIGYFTSITRPPPQAARAGLRYCSSCTCTRVASVEELYLCIKRVENSLRTGLGLFR